MCCAGALVLVAPLYFTAPDALHRFEWPSEGLDELTAELRDRLGAELDAVDGRE